MNDLISTPAQFEQILHSLANGVTIQDAQGKLLFVNKTAATMMDCASPEEAVVKGGADIVARFNLFDDHNQPLGLADLPGRQALKGGDEPAKIVGFQPVGGGEVRWTSIKAQAVLDKDGKVSLAVNVLQDITELKNTELRLREANDRVTELLAQALEPTR